MVKECISYFQDIDLTDSTDVVVSNIDLGLDENSIQTYWLSYDR